MRWVLAFLVALSQGKVFPLNQDTFSPGSVVIREPGLYRLTEDVEFRPNLGDLEDLEVESLEEPELFMFPANKQRFVNGKSFDLGFFAAIVVASDNVVIDLNGFTLSQSHIHGAMQRFFALIELANSPFPPENGPADFASPRFFTGANNVTVMNGRLGRSSHHGIHCNSCKDVTIRDLVIEDFEVGGISLNSADDVLIENVDIRDSSRDIRYSGHLSNIIFSLQAFKLYIEPFVSIPDSLKEEIEHNRESARKCLREVIAMEKRLALADSQFNYNVVNNELNQIHPIVRTITGGLPDGSLVTGILLHASVNVGDFKREFAEDQVENVLLKNVTISNLSLKTQELTLLRKSSGENLVDMIGAGFNLDAVRDLSSDDISCVLNPLAGFQLSLSKLKNAVEGDQSLGPGVTKLLSRDGITEEIVQWCDDKITWTELLKKRTLKISANKDIMFHQNKGVIGVKIDQSTSVLFENVLVQNLENHADLRSYFYENLPFASKMDLEEVLFDDESNFGVATRGGAFAANVDFKGSIKVESLFSTDKIRAMPVDFINLNEEMEIKVDHSTVCSEEGELVGKLGLFSSFFSLVKRNEFQELPDVDPQGGDGDSGSGDSHGFFVIIGIVVGGLIALLLLLSWSSKQKTSPSEKDTSVTHYTDANRL